MLNHLLAGIVALGSLILFLSGFLFPEVQRKPDLAWSGIALFYALLLFAEGDHTSGGALLAHIASVALILWFGWQTLQQRRQFTAPEAQTEIPGSFDAWMPFLKEGWGRIVVAYGETSAWVQEKMGTGDSPTQSEPQVPLASFSEDEDWESSPASAAAPSTETMDSVNSEPLSPEPAGGGAESEAIAPPPPEVLEETPLVVESLTESKSSSDQAPSDIPSIVEPLPSEPEAQAEVTPEPETAPEPDLPVAPPVAETFEITPDSAVKSAPETEPAPEPTLDPSGPAGLTATESAPSERGEVKHSDSEAERAPEGSSADQPLQETVRVEDDETWPPEDPVT